MIFFHKSANIILKEPVYGTRFCAIVVSTPTFSILPQFLDLYCKFFNYYSFIFITEFLIAPSVEIIDSTTRSLRVRWSTINIPVNFWWVRIYLKDGEEPIQVRLHQLVFTKPP